MRKQENINYAQQALSKLDDNELMALRFAMPWQMNVSEAEVDVDGFTEQEGALVRGTLQRTCWNKFNISPHINTAVRGQVGRLTGFGFEISSENQQIQDAIDETEYDPRNRLFSFWSKYMGRSIIEGELFLLLTVHRDGFIEVDFLDPGRIAGGGEDGVLYHPSKETMPLFYFVKNDSKLGYDLVPTIFMAYYPELIKAARTVKGFNEGAIRSSKNTYNKFNKLGGFNRFIVSWDKSFVTKRNVSHLRTVIEWLNHYENLKKYEIDHKKSAGAYLWVVTMEDAKAFRNWLALSDEDRRKTGVMAKKTPGSTLMLPPGMTLEAKNPKLPTISDEDTDILHMVTGGLNEPEDVSTGQSKGTFASVKASRGPMSDRISDEMAYFERFVKFDFYKGVFYLKAKVSDFPETFSIKSAVDFDEKKEPIFKDLKFRPEFLLEITFPVSEVHDAETGARAFLGVKHGSVNDVLGIPNTVIAKKMGFGNYRKLRLLNCSEQERYPELLPPVDSGGEQLEPGKQTIEKKEPVKKVIKKNPKKE